MQKLTNQEMKGVAGGLGCRDMSTCLLCVICMHAYDAGDSDYLCWMYAPACQHPEE